MMYKEVNNIIEKCSKQIGENNFSQKKLNAADHIEKKILLELIRLPIVFHPRLIFHSLLSNCP